MPRLIRVIIAFSQQVASESGLLPEVQIRSSSGGRKIKALDLDTRKQPVSSFISIDRA